MFQPSSKFWSSNDDETIFVKVSVCSRKNCLQRNPRSTIETVSLSVVVALWIQVSSNLFLFDQFDFSKFSEVEKSSLKNKILTFFRFVCLSCAARRNTKRIFFFVRKMSLRSWKKDKIPFEQKKKNLRKLEKFRDTTKEKKPLISIDEIIRGRCLENVTKKMLTDGSNPFHLVFVGLSFPASVMCSVKRSISLH